MAPPTVFILTTLLYMALPKGNIVLPHCVCLPVFRSRQPVVKTFFGRRLVVAGGLLARPPFFSCSDPGAAQRGHLVPLLFSGRHKIRHFILCVLWAATSVAGGLSG